MEAIIWIIHGIVALAIIGLVLMQHGKGADMGAAFGSGSSGSLFGASGSANFLSRTTAVLAAVFFLTSMGLTYFSSQKNKTVGVMETQKPQERPVVPVSGTKGAPAPGSAGSKAGEVPN